jgi:hypothetical protein
VRRESIDELLANINLDDFVRDYVAGSSFSLLKKKYNIFSYATLKNFINALISLGKLEKRTNVGQTSRWYSEYKPHKKFGNNKRKSLKNITRKKITIHKVLSAQNHMGAEKSLEEMQESTVKKETHNIDQIDEEIDDMFLGLETKPHKRRNTKDEEQEQQRDRSRLESVKEDFIRLWNAGVPRRYICKKLNVTELSLSKWKKKLGLPNRPVGSPLERLEKEIIHQKILEILNNNEGAVFMNHLIAALQLSKDRVKKIMKNSKELRSVELLLELPVGTRWTAADYFHSMSGETIIYINKGGFMLKLAQILCSSKINNEGSSTVPTLQ